MWTFLRNHKRGSEAGVYVGTGIIIRTLTAYVIPDVIALLLSVSVELIDIISDNVIIVSENLSNAL